MMDRLQILNKIEADARQFYKRYTAGLEILDDDLRMLTGFGVHLHNASADQSRVIKELKTAATNLVNTIEASKMLEAIWVGSNRRDEELEQIVGAKNIVKAALAEAKRIQEGK